MKVLITTPPGLGHVNPLLPLGSALERRRHDVVWATGPNGCRAVREAGMTALEAGPAAPPMSRLHELHPDLRSVPAHELPDHVFPKMWGGIAAPWMLRDLLAITDHFTPDLVVSDAVELAGPVVAARVGAPNVTKSFGALLPERRVAAGAEVVAPLWRSVGLEPRPYCGCYDHLYLDVYPAGLQPPLPEYVGRATGLRPPGAIAAGPAEHDRIEHDVARFLDDVDAPPLVYLTFGTETIFSDPSGLAAVVGALTPLDVRLLVTVGPGGDPAAIGEQPPTVHVARYVPQSVVLARASLVVSHGGSGTTLATLAHGLPHLVLPQGADQFLNADAVSRAGAGLALLPAEVTAAAIGTAAHRLLTDHHFSAAAGRMAAEIAVMPSPDDVADQLESLVC